MKEFNLEEAKAGKPVCTRDGKDARIICFDAKGYTLIIALVYYDEYEVCFPYTANGRIHTIDKVSNMDLMMKGEKHEGWINIYKDINFEEHRVGHYIHDTKEKALEGRDITNYITTIKIEWEE